MSEDSSSPTSVDEGRIAERIRVLVDRGLERYGEGDLRGALAEWEHALALEPSSEQAREYVDYVRANFDVLQASFDEAKEVARMAAELDVPFGLEAVREQEDGEDDYASFELEVSGGEGEDAEESAEESAEETAEEAAEESAEEAAEEAAGTTPRAVESVDEGWFLDDYADALPPPPETAAEPKRNLAEELQAVRGDMLALGADGGVPQEGAADGAGDLDDRDVGPGEGETAAEGEAPGGLDLGVDVGPAQAGEEGGDPRAQAAAEFEDEEETVERSASSGGASPVSPTSLVPEEDHGDDEEITVPGGEEPPPFSANVSLSRDAIEALGPRVTVRAPPEETTPERPGIVKRGITLTGLEELDSGMREDDRVLEDEEESSHQVTFRAAAAEQHAWAGSLAGEPEDPEEEEKTIERGASVTTDMDEELTVERRSDHFATPAVIVDESLMSDELPTVEQPLTDGAESAQRSPTAELDFGDGDQLTRERPRDMGAAAGLGKSPGGEVDAVAELRGQVLAGLDDDAPAEESEGDRARRRVMGLIQRARDEADAGQSAGAVAILDLALSEAPDNAAAQMVIHKHSDMLFDIYSRYVGDMNGVPTVAQPLEQLAADELDNRAVFLLSRIDGNLSFEEVLDVAGMPRLEAYRVLCKLLLQGILEVR